MTERYSRMVQDVVIEADRRAGARQHERLNKGVGLAQLLSDEGFAYQPTAVRAWMRGETRPPSDVLLALAEKTGISLDERLDAGREPSDLERRVADLQGQVDVLQRQVERLLGRERAAPDKETGRLLLAVRDGLREAARELDLPWEELPDDARDEDLAPVLEARMMDVRGTLGLEWSSPGSRTSHSVDVARDLDRQLEEVKTRLAEQRERRAGTTRRQVAN